ncbi:GNAT superfamily N-acetyltransferase [Sporomusaceae bacterium BoRhaA]|uniref:GNAT family N-acetyltransferase n=1 Tax=Pelorhabdus rhamnosifermentans TaxID=2772457 RepID=UPI001C061CD0|nr:GNAT family N-acetyltransferase [Pelorhabdus rhamnosifermentans]MBU2703498.1 GNAT superfamily N-acetyltransferase [Pelorhabdus rhamnosifermentans]
MINNLYIVRPTRDDVILAYQVFETAIADAFEKEGLGSEQKFINSEIMQKKRLLDAAIAQPNLDIDFLVAKLEEIVVGTISFGPCGEHIRECTEKRCHSVGELGSLYILPRYQGQGVGSALIAAMAEKLSKQGIDQFCLDSGYRRAQEKWLRKFGAPYKAIKDYWGPGSEHMIWFCNVADFVNAVLAAN